MPSQLQLQIPVPSDFTCPISLHLMRDPVSLCTGVTYDRASIEKWLDDGNNTCPVTRQVLQRQDLVPNLVLRHLIQDWGDLNRSNGMERIPTPVPPAEPLQVRSLLRDIHPRGGHTLAALESLKSLAIASDRNRKCLTKEKAVRALVESLPPELGDADREAVQASQEALECLVLLPVEEDDKRTLLATKMNTISWLLNRSASMDARVNAASLLETLAVEKSAALKIGTTKGIPEGLLALLSESRYPIAIKASLRALQALSLAPRMRLKLVQMEVIPFILDMLPRVNSSRAEQIMVLLSSLSCCADGRAAITGHALAIPAIAGSMLGVSEMATQHAVHILWSIANHAADDSVVHEFVLFGVFRRLLMAVQLDHNIQLKQRAKGLLRLMTEICGDASFTQNSFACISM